MNYTKLVDELNEELYQNDENTCEGYVFQTSGGQDLIFFGTKVIWDDQNDPCFSNKKKKYKKMKKFLKKELKNYGKKLQKLASLPID